MRYFKKYLLFVFSACLSTVVFSSVAFSQDMNRQILHASWTGEIAAVSKLLSDGAAVDAKDSYGKTPLMNASFKGYTKIASLLLENGADVNAKTVKGQTPLMAAAFGGVPLIVNNLLDAGADLNAKDAL